MVSTLLQQEFTRQYSKRRCYPSDHVHRDISDLRVANSQALGTAMQAAVTFLVCMSVALIYSWKLTLVIVASIPILAIVLGFFSSKVQLNLQKQSVALGEASKYISSAISVIETVKCFNAQEYEASNYKGAIQRAAEYRIAQARWNALQSGFLQFAAFTLSAQSFWFGSFLVSRNDADAKTVMTAFWSATIAVEAVMQLMPLLSVFERGRSASASLSDILAYDNEESSEETRCVLEQCRGSLEFKDVSFTKSSSIERCVTTSRCHSHIQHP